MVEVHLCVPHGNGGQITEALSALRERLQPDQDVSLFCNGLRFAGRADLVFNQLYQLYSQDGLGQPAVAISSPAAERQQSLPALVMQPVGVVRSPFKAPADVDDLLGVDAQIVIDRALLDALQGMVVGERYLVLFCFHQATTYELLQHPRGDISRPQRGVFGLRSPRRPNAIGVSDVMLKVVDGNVLTVSGLDALDGSPVLDMKPVLHGTTLP